MTHQYEITGMTCAHCEARIQKALLSNPEISEVKLNLETKEARITMKSHVPTAVLQDLVGKAGVYSIAEKL